MIIKYDRYNELKKNEMFDILVRVARKKEDIFVQMFGQYQAGTLASKDIPDALDEHLIKMHDEIWLDMGIEEEEIFNDFYDHKCSFNSRYVSIRDASWRRLAGSLTK